MKLKTFFKYGLPMALTLYSGCTNQALINNSSNNPSKTTESSKNNIEHVIEDELHQSKPRLTDEDLDEMGISKDYLVFLDRSLPGKYYAHRGDAMELKRIAAHKSGNIKQTKLGNGKTLSQGNLSYSPKDLISVLKDADKNNNGIISNEETRQYIKNF